jgi:hypothetical protein
VARGLIVVRLVERALGLNLYALACGAILVRAGLRERAKRPPDDLPPSETPPIRRRPRPEARLRRPAARAADETEPLPPPEFKPYWPAAGEQLRLGGDDPERRPPDA